METLKLLFQLYFRPVSATSELMDRGNWLVAAILVLVVSVGFYLTVNSNLQEGYAVPRFDYEAWSEIAESGNSEQEITKRRDAMMAEYEKRMAERPRIPLLGDNFFKLFSFMPAGFLQPLVSLACFYIPLTILLVTMFGGLGNFGVVLGKDYGTLSVCAMTAWAAAHLPFAIAGFVLNSQAVAPQVYFGMWAASGLLFGIFMVFVLRVVFGVNYGAAIMTVALSWLGFTLGMYVFRFVSPLLFSPFILFYAYMYFGGRISGEARDVGNVFRQRQNFKRFLHNATVNPRDADAHVQLGLIYNQRRQSDKALEHFKKAFEIDKKEPDANYELGKIARRKGEYPEAIEYFSTVAEQNDKHSVSEVWREAGATYLEAQMPDEAIHALERFLERRPYDPEGLYYYGKALKAKGETEKAKESFIQAIESAKTSPDYRKHGLRHWIKMAEKEI